MYNMRKTSSVAQHYKYAYVTILFRLTESYSGMNKYNNTLKYLVLKSPLIDVLVCCSTMYPIS